MDLRFPRRRFLALALLSLARPLSATADAKGLVTRTYEVEVSVLFNLLTFAVKGTIAEEIDAAAGRYRVTLTGAGTGVSTRTTGQGIIQDGRFKPAELESVHVVRGRENRTSLKYDYRPWPRRVPLGQLHAAPRAPPSGRRRRRRWPRASTWTTSSRPSSISPPTSSTATRTARTASRWCGGRGPPTRGRTTSRRDGYRAELATAALPRRARRRPRDDLTARLDLTGFSSWARRDSARPRDVRSGPAPRVACESPLMLGTNFVLRLARAVVSRGDPATISWRSAR